MRKRFYFVYNPAIITHIREMVTDLNALYSIDSVACLENMLVDELRKSIAKEIE